MHIHDLRISGFDNAIQADLTNNAEVHHVTVEGRTAQLNSRGISFQEKGFFTSSLTPNGHMTGNSIHSNSVSGFGTGISMMNNDAARCTITPSRTHGKASSLEVWAMWSCITTCWERTRFEG